MDDGLRQATDDERTRTPGLIPGVQDSQPDGGARANNISSRTSFIEARLPVGTVVQITNPANDAAGRETVRLIGYLDRKSVLVTHPTRDGQIMFVKEGTSYRCRVFSGRNAYAFEANVLHVALVPFPYLHLSYPTIVHSNAIRNSARIATDITATAGAIGSGNPTTCTIKDLSVSGALIHSKVPVAEAQSEVTLAFRLSIDDELVLFEIAAEVRNVQKGGETEANVVKTGLRFQKLAAAQRREMEIFIYRQMLSDS